jgi:hypothetical protein
MLKNNLQWFPYLEKVEMKQGEENLDKEVAEIYTKILMGSRYKIFEQKIMKTSRTFSTPSLMVEYMPKDLIMNEINEL